MKLGVYVHIPFCKRKCNYCAFVSGDFGRTALYLAALEREIEKRMPERRPDTLYVGGGTPSYAGSEMICRAASAICRGGMPEEMTVEMNPDTVSASFMESVMESGFNRFSVGVQSSDNYTLKRLGRVYGRERVFKSLKIVSEFSSNTSVDIIWGFPGRKPSFDFIDEFSPQHVSTYLLTIEPGTHFHRSGFKQKKESYVEKEYYYILEELDKRGYKRYEVSNFSKRGFESKHNMIYWNVEDRYLGFGLSACSYDGKSRSCNTSDYDEYLKGRGLEAEKEMIDGETSNFEAFMLKMRTTEGVDENSKLKNYLNAEEVESQISRGFLKRSGGMISFTDSGFLIMNTLIPLLFRD